ncbi:hypothetical protein ElyMa_002874400 [Elysia marginata]|uniref:Uncharacterized protein n=1 Tax=Elysia marginata TaxID=1093978 RepID=A0AAV4I1H6_9GAST|nr:hypothetical protein ElyMa_002874400 [Elysia marginata]
MLAWLVPENIFISRYCRTSNQPKQAQKLYSITDTTKTEYLSDTENYEYEDGRYPGMRYPPRRTSYDVSRPYREQVPPYRRSHSLAELQAEREREKLAAQQEGMLHIFVGLMA